MIIVKLLIYTLSLAGTITIVYATIAILHELLNSPAEHSPKE